MRNFIVIIITLILAFFVIRRHKNKKKSVINERKNQLKKLYKREAVFLCDFIEEIDDNLLQLYGESVNTFLRPGMKVVIYGAKHIIKEVYANDDTPDKPDSAVSAEVADTPIVIEKGTLDWKNFRHDLNRDGVIPLKME